jgi:transcriptional regulator with XRE-family HTH domain
LPIVPSATLSPSWGIVTFATDLAPLVAGFARTVAFVPGSVADPRRSGRATVTFASSNRARAQRARSRQSRASEPPACGGGYGRAVRDIQAGRALRALRVRRRLSQRELAALSRVPQSTISRAERGHLSQLPLATTRRMFEALDASVEVDVRWRRGELERLVDREHASLVEAVVRRLRRVDWLVEVEVSYSIYGERGSIDVLAFDLRSLTLLVVEVKSELAAVEATLRKVDEKVRLAPDRAPSLSRRRATGSRPRSCPG